LVYPRWRRKNPTIQKRDITANAITKGNILGEGEESVPCQVISKSYHSSRFCGEFGQNSVIFLNESFPSFFIYERVKVLAVLPIALFEKSGRLNLFLSGKTERDGRPRFQQ